LLERKIHPHPARNQSPVGAAGKLPAQKKQLAAPAKREIKTLRGGNRRKFEFQ
jgi:hypothetical protein